LVLKVAKIRKPDYLLTKDYIFLKILKLDYFLGHKNHLHGSKKPQRKVMKQIFFENPFGMKKGAKTSFLPTD